MTDNDKCVHCGHNSNGTNEKAMLWKMLILVAILSLSSLSFVANGMIANHDKDIENVKELYNTKHDSQGDDIDRNTGDIQTIFDRLEMYNP